MNLFKKDTKDTIKIIYQKDRFKRYTNFLIGILMAALAFNIFILPTNIVFGVSGIGVIFNHLWNIDPSLVILIGSLILLILSYFLMGWEKTANSVIGSLLFPVFVELTEWVIPLIDLGNTEPILIAIFGAVISGFGFGLVFKSGFTTGGMDILKQIFSKYLKISIGNATIFTDGIVITLGLFVFGIEQFMYSLITVYVIGIITDKVILGISNSKAFHIITNKEEEIKKYLIDNLNCGVTVLDVKGGYTNNRQKMLMCIIPTKEYFKVKEGISNIDLNAFFLVTDAYEVSGGFVKKEV